ALTRAASYPPSIDLPKTSLRIVVAIAVTILLYFAFGKLKIVHFGIRRFRNNEIENQEQTVMSVKRLSNWFSDPFYALVNSSTMEFKKVKGQYMQHDPAWNAGEQELFWFKSKDHRVYIAEKKSGVVLSEGASIIHTKESLSKLAIENPDYISEKVQYARDKSILQVRLAQPNKFYGLGCANQQFVRLPNKKFPSGYNKHGLDVFIFWVLKESSYTRSWIASSRVEVIEGRSGIALAWGNDIYEAYQKYDKRMTTEPDEVMREIESSIEYHGLSPRYKKVYFYGNVL
ncbi:MAG: hypothetical protein AAB116_26450, partial [Candidatus Poribacteria bacterium]